MAPRVVTLDIDSTTIRLLETRGKRVTRWATASLEPGVVENGAISDPKALGASIKRLMKSSGIKAGKVRASISGIYSISRVLSVPDQPEGTLGGAVLEAVKGLMPVPEGELYIAWQTIGLFEDQRQVLALGVPRNLVDAQVQALRSAGVTVEILDIKAMALTRAVNQAQALILNIEPSTLDIVVVVAGMPQVMRTILFKKDLSPEERAERTAQDLEVAVSFYNSRHPGSPVDPATPLFLTGEMAAEPALVERLQARGGYPLRPVTPPLECPAQLPAPRYAVNMGLALKTAEKKAGEIVVLSPDINILPAIYQPRKWFRRQSYLAVLILAAAIALLDFFYVATTTAMDQTAALRDKLAILDQKMELRQAEIKNRTAMTATIQEYQALRAKRGTFTGDLEAIYSQAQKLGIAVDTVTHEGSKVEISYKAGDYPTFKAYFTALEETGRFLPVAQPTPTFPWPTGGKIEARPKK